MDMIDGQNKNEIHKKELVMDWFCFVLQQEHLINVGGLFGGLLQLCNKRPLYSFPIPSQYVESQHSPCDLNMMSKLEDCELSPKPLAQQTSPGDLFKENLKALGVVQRFSKWVKGWFPNTKRIEAPLKFRFLPRYSAPDDFFWILWRSH